MREYYENSNANAHRGGNALAEEATGIYESARKKVARFIDAAASEIVFTRNATEALNFAARFCVEQMGAKKILLTETEHHSNIVNWQLAAKGKATIDYVKLRSAGAICNEDVEGLIETVKEILIKHHRLRRIYIETLDWKVPVASGR